MFKKRSLYFTLAALLASVSLGGYYYLNKPGENAYLTIVGPVQMCDGIARQSAELANAMMDKVSVNLIPTNKLKVKKKNWRVDVPESVIKIVKRKDKRLGKVVIFEEVLGKKDFDVEAFYAVAKKEEQIRIAYSMFESTLIPSDWVSILNTYYDAVAVPDEFLVDVYHNSGVQIPVFVLPLGLDLKSFISQPLKEKRNYPMVFANFSTCIHRKNHLTLIQAFSNAFGNRKDVVLKLNCRSGTKGLKQVVQDEIASLNCSNIVFTEEALDKESYLEMFRSIDCYVSLSKGEGFSIQPREAMVLGIPVIATNNTGQSTICKTNLVRSIPSPIPVPAVYFEFDEPIGFQFDCSVTDVELALKDMYENYDSYLRRGDEARKWASQYEFSNKSLELYVSLVFPENITLGTENKLTTSGMTTSSQVLYEKYLKLGCVQTLSTHQ